LEIEVVMLFFIPWALLIIAVIVAVPVAVKMSPSPGGGRAGNEAGQANEYGETDPQSALADDFATDSNEFDAEPIGDDAFAEFN
jgi:hypothetical protein